MQWLHILAHYKTVIRPTGRQQCIPVPMFRKTNCAESQVNILQGTTINFFTVN